MRFGIARYRTVPHTLPMRHAVVRPLGAVAEPALFTIDTVTCFIDKTLLFIRSIGACQKSLFKNSHGLLAHAKRDILAANPLLVLRSDSNA